MATQNALRVTFKQKVTRDQLISSLDHILGKFGCPTCGLNGHGVYFRGDGGDPEIAVLQRGLTAISPGVEVEGMAGGF